MENQINNSPPKPKTQLVIIRETVRESIIIDGCTFGAALAIALLGHAIDSSAAQWFGIVCLGLAMLDTAAGKAKRLSFAEARAEIDRLEKEEA